MTPTIQQAIDTIIASIVGAPYPETVDTVKTGDTSQPLKGIAVTFLTSVSIIEQVIAMGANLIITHEPTFYNHEDKTDWLDSHATYLAKRALLEKHNIVVWRFHDYLHTISPDPTVEGLRQAFGWEANPADGSQPLYQIEPVTLRELTAHVKKSLGIQTLRVVGDLDMECHRIVLAPGFPGAGSQIGLGFSEADVVITGEIHEWETSEYTRDATLTGNKKGLIVTGHAASEEPGIQLMVPWLITRLPGVEIRFMPTETPFHYL
jgi:putative NIF3 family GTP cyclohydrolase 1 type 2